MTPYLRPLALAVRQLGARRVLAEAAAMALVLAVGVGVWVVLP